MDSNPNRAISTPMIWFHWLSGMGMILVLVSGLIMDDGPSNLLFNAHVSFGILVLAVSIPRLVARLMVGMPQPVAQRGKLEDMAAKIVLYSLLALTVLLPLSGIALTLGEGDGLSLFGLPLILPGNEIEWLEKLGEGIHEFAGETLLPVLLLLHVSASLLHHLVKRDGILLRMLGRT